MRYIELDNGTRIACNNDGTGLFERGWTDNAYRQLEGNGQAGPFRSAEQFIGRFVGPGETVVHVSANWPDADAVMASLPLTITAGRTVGDVLATRRYGDLHA